MRLVGWLSLSSFRARMARNSGWPPLVGLTATAVVAGLNWLAPPALTDVNLTVFDTYQRLSPRASLGEESPVRMVLIDEESLARVGQWPWPRSEIAALVDRLTQLGAASIAFDMVFAEPDRTSPPRIAGLWRKTAPDLADAIDASGLPDSDDTLADAIRKAPVALGAFLGPFGASEPPRFPASVSVQGDDPRAALTAFPAIDASLPAFSEAAAGLGSVSLSERRGDVVRTVPLLSRIEGVDRLAPALSIEALRVAVGAPGYLLRSTTASGELAGGEAAQAAGLRVGPFTVPLTPQGALWVRFAEKGAGPTPIPAWRLMDADPPQRVLARLRNDIEGRIVFIGGSAAGLRDLVATPADPQTPGVSVHAEIVEQIITGAHLSRPDWVIGAEALATVALGLAISLTFAMRAPVLAAVATVLGAGGIAAISWLAFSRYGLLVGPLFPIAGAIAPAMAAGFASYALSDRERRAVRNQFQHFVPADVVAEISRDPDRFLNPSGETRVLTLLFADVRGFSRLSEGMAPDALLTLLNDVLTPLSDAVIEQGGTIDKFMGDAMMSFWNAPRPLPDHAKRALTAALALSRALADLNNQLEEQGRGRVEVGVGVNTGFCSVGSMGSRRRLDYSCIGDPVNVASRLEGLTRQYGVGICVGEQTVDEIERSEFALLEIDRVRVKGRDTPEKVFTLIGGGEAATSPAFEVLEASFAAALSAYRAQNWKEARELYTKAGSMDAMGLGQPGLAEAFLERIDHLETAPPGPGWDGVWTATQK